jgi:ribosome modulation factor
MEDNQLEEAGGQAMIAEAYYNGYWEALEGHERDANPYRSDVIRWRSWDEGWEDAQSEQWVSDR